VWVRSEDAAIAEYGARVPSSASRDFGEPFESILTR
jgi:hypothetical protein